MKKFLVFTVVASLLVACGEAEVTSESEDQANTEVDQAAQEEEAPPPIELAAINDELRHADGAVECLTKQMALVKAGKFDEAITYYSSRMQTKVKAEIAANPGVVKEWQAAINVSEKELQEIIQSVRENPDFFVFEEGQWRMNQK